MTLKGADKFIQAVNAKGANARQVAGIVRSKTSEIQSQAQRLEPVKTGNLKRQTTIAVSNSSQKIVGTVTANATNRGFNYGYAQEHGTRYITGKHFLETAYNANKQDFINKIKGVVKK